MNHKKDVAMDHKAKIIELKAEVSLKPSIMYAFLFI